MAVARLFPAGQQQWTKDEVLQLLRYGRVSKDTALLNNDLWAQYLATDACAQAVLPVAYVDDWRGDLGDPFPATDPANPITFWLANLGALPANTYKVVVVRSAGRLGRDPAALQAIYNLANANGVAIVECPNQNNNHIATLLADGGGMVQLV
jgi:hypothetical protein